MAIALIAAIWAALIFCAGPARAQQTDDHPQSRGTKHS
jgi:hypothetical protein